MSKFGTFGAYPEDSLRAAEAALLTAWRSLDRYHDDLVLLGGLAVHYLTKRDAAGLPGAVGMHRITWPQMGAFIRREVGAMLDAAATKLAPAPLVLQEQAVPYRTSQRCEWAERLAA